MPTNKIGTLQTLHDGMGRFEYNSMKNAIAKVGFTKENNINPSYPKHFRQAMF
ncbi:hypothetical protein NXW18_00050 [Bacteroides thetaiotaomicron]|uniref:hypothetical protein n=1 Tax=Bacteroides thetaiotaomicron TaxID=818 RepID=UPI0021651D4A|nr:hypothetical protein [Bacteroides thetaiotaomicron]MCS2872160.1 hypothetical protein [Bacteroides thetaiotaomicron]